MKLDVSWRAINGDELAKDTFIKAIQLLQDALEQGQPLRIEIDFDTDSHGTPTVDIEVKRKVKEVPAQTWEAGVDDAIRDAGISDHEGQ